MKCFVYLMGSLLVVSVSFGILNYNDRYVLYMNFIIVIMKIVVMIK